MNAASSLYRELSAPELDAVTAAHLNTTDYHAALLKGGLFNTTYLITPSAGEKAVLRVGPVNRHLLLPFEENLMEAERHVYERCAPLGIPVPRVLACDTTKQIIDRDYMLTAYIESVALSELGADARTKQAIHREAGRYMRQMHGIEGGRFGRVAEVLRGRGYDRWSDCLQSEIAGFSEKAAQVKIYSIRQLRRIEQIYARHAGLLNEITAPHLVHGDLWGGNILVSKENTFAAIIDADRAVYGDTGFEFAGGWMTDDAFCEGYGQPLTQDEAHVTRRRLYALLYKLLDSYVWLAQYNNRRRSRANKIAALRLMNKL